MSRAKTNPKIVEKNIQFIDKKPLIISIAAILLIAVITIAFFVGRQSADVTAQKTGQATRLSCASERTLVKTAETQLTLNEYKAVLVEEMLDEADKAIERSEGDLEYTQGKLEQCLGDREEFLAVMEDITSEVRENANNLMDQARESVQDAAEAIQDNIEGAREEIQERVEGVRERAQDRIEGVRERAENAVENAQETLQGVAENVQDRVEEVVPVRQEIYCKFQGSTESWACSAKDKECKGEIGCTLNIWDNIGTEINVKACNENKMVPVTGERQEIEFNCDIDQVTTTVTCDFNTLFGFVTKTCLIMQKIPGSDEYEWFSKCSDKRKCSDSITVAQGTRLKIWSPPCKPVYESVDDNTPIDVKVC